MNYALLHQTEIKIILCHSKDCFIVTVPLHLCECMYSYSITETVMRPLALFLHVRNFVIVYDKHEDCPALAARDECTKSNWTSIVDRCPRSCELKCK